MKYKGELYVLISALGFSLMPTFAKTAYKGGANVTTVLLFRFIIAFIFIWAYIFYKKLNFKIKLKQILMLAILGGIFYSGTSITLFNSYKFITGALAEVLMFTYPAWVLVMAALFFKEKLRINKIYAVILSIIGTTLVAYSPIQKFSLIGVFLALISAVLYALYVSFIDHGEFQGIDSIVMTGYILLFGMLSFAAFGFIRGEVSIALKPASWVCIVLLALLSTAIAILSFCEGAKLIGSGRAAIVSTFEPLSTFIFGYIFLGEKVTFYMIIGGAIIIMAILSIHIFENKKL